MKLSTIFHCRVATPYCTIPRSITLQVEAPISRKLKQPQIRDFVSRGGIAITTPLEFNYRLDRARGTVFRSSCHVSFINFTVRRECRLSQQRGREREKEKAIGKFLPSRLEGSDDARTSRKSCLPALVACYRLAICHRIAPIDLAIRHYPAPHARGSRYITYSVGSRQGPTM